MTKRTHVSWSYGLARYSGQTISTTVQSSSVRHTLMDERTPSKTPQLIEH
ncbi:hypothetical protein Plhal304r1_c041g0119231 [Plasmopara halstedii]